MESFPSPLDIRQQDPFQDATQVVCDHIKANQREHLKGILIIPTKHQKELIKNCRPEHVISTIGEGDGESYEVRGNLFLKLNGVVRPASGLIARKVFGHTRGSSITNYNLSGETLDEILEQLTAEQRISLLRFAFANRYLLLEKQYAQIAGAAEKDPDRLHKISTRIDKLPSRFFEAIERLIPTGS
ncbi:MAG: hypothetical protein ABIA92_03690 [Patescibacteria group bacterium]